MQIREICLKDRIEQIPVVQTGQRWPARHEIRNPEILFQRFPQCREDPKRRHFGDSRELPPRFSKGGGFFPVLLRMHNGDLACVFRTGAIHVGSGGEISISFSKDRGKTWSDYQVIVRGDAEKDLDMRNVSLGQAANGDLVLAYGISPGRHVEGVSVAVYDFRDMVVIRSTDGGKTWSEPNMIERPPDGAAVHPYGQMRCLRNGTLVFNARGYYSSEEYRTNPNLPGRMTYLYWSVDDGQSWGEPTLIRAGKTETGFLPLDERHWVAYVRHNNAPSMIAHSFDGGKTWPRWDEMLRGDPLTRTRRLPGSLTKLPNGYVLITYGYREYPFGVRAVISHDGGDTFDMTTEFVIADSFLHWDCGYPSTVCLDDGTIVTVAYTLEDIEHPEWGTCAIAYRYYQDLFDAQE